MTQAGLDPESLALLLQTLKELGKDLITPEKSLAWDEKDTLPEEVIRTLLSPEIGLHLVFLPDDCGGMGGGARDIYRVSEEMAKLDLGIATAFLAIALGSETFPPYRTGNIAWLRYVLGGLLFGVGMTLGSGCGNKTLVRVGGGNLKSLVVLAVAAIAAYGMLWTPLFERAFLPWIGPGTVNLAGYGIQAQDLGALATKVSGAENAAGSRIAVGAVIALAVLAFVFASREFRQSFDNILGGAVIGLAVVAGWWITAGPMGRSWKEWAEMATEVPSRVQTQSYTFISPMGDIVRWIMEPTHLTFVNFGIVALLGVIAGSFLYS